MFVFTLATLSPLLLLSAGWAWAGLLWMTALTALLDQIAPFLAPDAPEDAEFPAAEALLLAIGVLHLLALPWAVWLITSADISVAARVALMLGFGLWFGQVAVPAAHELIHRGGRVPFNLGRAVYVSILFGHHTTAHRLVHHRFAASADDPNTAREGESFYRFALRAWAGSFRQGLAAENRRTHRLHPYAIYLGGAALALALAFVLAGGWGVPVWLGLSLHAQMQLLLADYVQHYGLTRRTLNGRLEPVGPRHSWNAKHWFSSAMMLNAPRHSDHHANPSRPFHALRLPKLDEAPRLPCSLPAACTMALVPPLWRAKMHPRLERWRAVASDAQSH